MKDKTKNPMREILIDKVTLNVGVGGPGPELEKAKKLLKMITGEKIVTTKSKKRIPTWGVRKGMEIGVKTTLRKDKAITVLKRLLEGVENKLRTSCFDDHGNVSFGIKEYINVPTLKYDPEIGIIGLNVSITLKRRGYNIKFKGKKIGKKHLITKKEAIEWFTKKFKVSVE